MDKSGHNRGMCNRSWHNNIPGGFQERETCLSSAHTALHPDNILELQQGCQHCRTPLGKVEDEHER